MVMLPGMTLKAVDVNLQSLTYPRMKLKATVRPSVIGHEVVRATIWN
jgi:hypothetical protein